MRLLPENPDVDPVELDLREDTLMIEGLVPGCCGCALDAAISN